LRVSTLLRGVGAGGWSALRVAISAIDRRVGVGRVTVRGLAIGACVPWRREGEVERSFLSFVMAPARALLPKAAAMLRENAPLVAMPSVIV
jgi:hypothetical protein